MDDKKMSARGYFSLRNAIPGYAFILILIIINHVPLIKILQNQGQSDFFGAFLAFFYLLSGGAIGFLISQGWWWNWQRKAGILGDREYDRAVDAFCELYGVQRPEKIREQRLLVTAMDFSDHTKIDKDHKELLTLAERRWDMFHTLSITFYSLILGLAIGFSARIYFRFTLQPTPYFDWPEGIILIFMEICVFILIFLIRNGADMVRQMSADLNEAIVRSYPVKPTTLRRVLPRLGFTQNTPRPDEDDH